MASENDQRPAKRTRYDFEEGMIVLVGPSEKQYVLHKAVVCKSSDFFRAVYANNWKESTESKVRFPEVKPETFAAYIGWLYTGKIEIVEKSESDLLNDDANAKAPIQRLPWEDRLVDCFCFGDVLQDAEFRNAVTDEFTSLGEIDEMLPSSRCIEDTMKKLPHDCKLVEIMADYYATTLCIEAFNKLLPELPL